MYELLPAMKGWRISLSERQWLVGLAVDGAPKANHDDYDGTHSLSHAFTVPDTMNHTSPHMQVCKATHKAIPLLASPRAKSINGHGWEVCDLSRRNKGSARLLVNDRRPFLK